MAGLGTPHAGAALLSGIVYEPYYLGTFLVAAMVVWTAPQTWDWTWTLTPRQGRGDRRRCSSSRSSR